MTFDDNDKKSFDFAADAAKQLVTLSTAIIGLTITFFKDFAGKDDQAAMDLMPWAWGLLLVSLLAGLLHLYALTGTLSGPGPHRIQGKVMMATSGVQQVLFIAGMMVVVIAGAKAL